jgi:hypothetical protein
MSLDFLLGKQNSDGGWPYVRGVSWTEPTVYAVLALLSAGTREPAERGLRWIQSLQRPDGGWSTQAAIPDSAWVTALVALLPPPAIGARAHSKAIHWLATVQGEESTPLYHLREWLLGNPRPPELEFPGWPWVRGTAAWVGPTALAILALEKACGDRDHPDLKRRIDSGRKFLLRHMCHEGGWNHGSVRALGYESRPYPEITGLALAAFRGVRTPEIDRSLTTARTFFSECRSADAFNWLRFGLIAHGSLPQGRCTAQPRTISETALDMLARAAQEGRNVLWE